MFGKRVQLLILMGELNEGFIFRARSAKWSCAHFTTVQTSSWSSSLSFHTEQWHCVGCTWYTWCVGGGAGLETARLVHHVILTMLIYCYPKAVISAWGTRRAGEGRGGGGASYDWLIGVNLTLLFLHAVSGDIKVMRVNFPHRVAEWEQQRQMSPVWFWSQQV